MRQIGNLDNETQAQRFAAFLVTKGVNAHAEPDSDGWVIWVRDEDQLHRARSEMEQFRADPDGQRYRGVEKHAESIRREEAKRREQVRKNVVEMGGRWKQPGVTRRTALVSTLIALSVLLTFWTWVDQSKVRLFSFTTAINSPMANIQNGEIWRLVTPIFVHGSPGNLGMTLLHLFFNMYLLQMFGSMIEERRGTLRFALMVLAIAVISNVAQAFSYPFFGGMSGVVYGLFGYAWMKTVFAPADGILINRNIIVFLMAWFVLCFFMPNVANMAHGAGLAVGAAMGYLPVLLRSR